MEYWSEIIIAVIAFLGTLIGSLTANSKTLWRIQELEKKQEIHNRMLERVYKLEAETAAQWKWIYKFKEDEEGK
jgi:hypothetical protein